MARHGGLVFVVAAWTAILALERPREVSAETALGACQKRGATVALTPNGQVSGSTVLFAKWSGTTTALVADEDDAMVRAIDVDNGAVKGTAALSGTPSQMAVLGDGRIAVTLRDKNQVQLLEPSTDGRTLTPLCAVDVADEPVGLALTPNGARLLVTSEYGRALTTLDTKTMSTVSVTPLARDPRSVIVDDDGKRAFVSHVVGGKLSIVDLEEKKAKEVPLDPTKKLSFVTNPIEQKAVQGFALAKSIRVDRPQELDGDSSEPKVFMPLAVADPGEPQVRTSGYGSGRPGPAEVPFVAVIDAKAERKLTSEINGEDLHRSRECMLPRATRFLARSNSLLVACMGIDMLVSLDAKAKEPSRSERMRWRVGAGPTGIAVDAEEKRAVVWSQFDHLLTVIPLGDPKAAPKRIAIARSQPLSEKVALGRILFHKSDDPRLSRDGRACASCHPDGREDALTWATPSGPRQTIMLAGRTKGSAPFSWSGTNATIEEHVLGTFQRLGGTGMKKEDADLAALLEYVAVMKTPAARTKTEALVARGRDLFFADRQGCSSCHIGGAGTDNKTHVVGQKGDAPIDTPSLRFVRATAPYFHDGRYPSLDALLKATDHRMGSAAHLDANDRRALVAFLETL